MLINKPRYFDKDGKPMTLMEWAKRFEDHAYRRIAETTLPNGLWVSTVWLGNDHRFFGKGKPIIFETMVFPPKGSKLPDLDCVRYTNLTDAQEGHNHLCEKWKDWKEVKE